MEMVLQQSQMTKKEQEEEADELRRGPWTVDEDLTLINYIAEHGDGRWNALARTAGLKRTGKSCRLRWLNYLRPDVKRGDFTADEQLLILDLHSRWGNRWSKIAAQLPGRTDNEIKNYWRTRVQKHAKRLNCDATSARFKDAIAAFLWAPHLADRAQSRHATATANAIVDGISADPSSSAMVTTSSLDNNHGYSSPSSALTTAITATPSSSATSTSSFASSSCDQSVAPHDEKPSGAARAHGGETASCGDWWTAQGSDHDEFIWSTAPATTTMQQLNVVDEQFQDLQDLSGWVEGFAEGISENNHWSLEDAWRMQ